MKRAEFHKNLPNILWLYQQQGIIDTMGIKSCLELRLNEHLDFRTSAVDKHLYECEHFHHIVKLFNISAHSNSEPSFTETWYHISSAISRNTQIIDHDNNWTQLLFLESLYIK